jgi:hypothetical protein
MMLTNILPYKKYLGGLLLFLGCLTMNRCSEKHDDPVLIRVGDYSVTRERFRKGLERLNAEGTTLTREEKMTAVLDDFINAGLVLSLSRQHECFNDENYRRGLKYYKGVLYSKYGKMIRSGLSVSSTDINDDPDGPSIRHMTVIDYIYIPASQRETYKVMRDRMNAGARITDLLRSPKLEEWSRLRLRFYANISTSSALLPENILQKIKKMSVGDLSFFEDGAGMYIVKVTKKFAEPGAPQSTVDHLLQLKMAEAVEKGDTLMDPYDLDRLTQINNDLYDPMNCAVLPIMDPIVPGDADPVVVEFLGKKIHETQLSDELSGLPLSIQGLFRNKSTRIRAVTNYVLHAYAGLLVRTEQEKIADIGRIRQFVGDRLRADKVTDTVSWLVKLFRQKPANGNSTAAFEILADAAGCGRVKEDPSFPNPSVPKDEGPRTTEKIRDYSWIFNDNQPGRESLRLNFQAIRKMTFGRVAGVSDNQVLAAGGNWKLRVGDFRKQLAELTPATRLELCKNDNSIKAIYYLAHYRGGPDNKASVKINYALVDRVDLVGDDLDSLSNFKANGAVASLGHTVLTEDKIRDIIATMPENERTAFLQESDSHNEALEKILWDQFWQDQVRPQQPEGNPQLKEELENYENWLLADTYYNKVIYVQPSELNDESLDPYIREACKLLGQERLREALVKAAQQNCIKVDTDLFRALGGNITVSAYSGLINKNCH